MVRWELVGDQRVLRAGSGEWYNQPHDRRWDMGEDAQELPPTEWQLAVVQLREETEEQLPNLIVDFSEFDWLVGQDWGFLVRLAVDMASYEARLTVVVPEPVAQTSSSLGVGEILSIVKSVDEALR